MNSYCGKTVADTLEVTCVLKGYSLSFKNAVMSIKARSSESPSAAERSARTSLRESGLRKRREAARRRW